MSTINDRARGTSLAGGPEMDFATVLKRLAAGQGLLERPKEKAPERTPGPLFVRVVARS
jgi:hypothetical protein